MIAEVFTIEFSLNIPGSNAMLPVKAEVELHHSDTYYTVKNLQIEKQQLVKTEPSFTSFFTSQMEIKAVENNGHRLWVHCDSEKDSLLSAKAGQAIDNHLRKLK